MKQKLSKYVHFFEERTSKILYNLATDSILRVDDKLSEAIQKNADDADVLRNIYPALYDALVKNNFIVASNVDETQCVIDQWKNCNDNLSVFRLTINPTLNCNLHCWYCYENHRGEKTMNEHTLNNLKAFIENTIKKKELSNFILDFFGGEPLLSFDKIVLPLIECMKKCCESYKKHGQIIFTSNGVLLSSNIFNKLDKYNQLFPIFFQITLDGNKEKHDQIRCDNKGKGTFDMIIKHVHQALKCGYSICVRLNYTNDNIDSFIDIISYFNDLTSKERNQIEFDFHKVWQDPYSVITENKVKKIIQQFEHEKLRIVTLNKYSAEFCIADKKNSMVINYNGCVYKCTAREFFNETREGELDGTGKIQTNNRYDQRMKIRFGNEFCRACKIFPICHGGCSQDKIEYSERHCVRNYTEEEKEEIIWGRLESLIHKSLIDAS